MKVISRGQVKRRSGVALHLSDAPDPFEVVWGHIGGFANMRRTNPRRDSAIYGHANDPIL